VASQELSLAINGRERQLSAKLVPYRPPAAGGNGHGPGPATVAIVGLGYVGLPTALALHGRSPRILGIDISAGRLAVIAAREADLAEADRPVLDAALRSGAQALAGTEAPGWTTTYGASGAGALDPTRRARIARRPSSPGGSS